MSPVPGRDWRALSCVAETRSRHDGDGEARQERTVRSLLECVCACVCKSCTVKALDGGESGSWFGLRCGSWDRSREVQDRDEAGGSRDPTAPPQLRGSQGGKVRTCDARWSLPLVALGHLAHGGGTRCGGARKEARRPPRQARIASKQFKAGTRER